jgi:hypothetical protein
MTEAETKKALEDETKIGPVLEAMTEVFRRRYAALLPKALAFLDHPNETFRASAIGAYFNFMSDQAVVEVGRALRMLKDDPSPMVRGAAATALRTLRDPRHPNLISPSLRRDILRALAQALRQEEEDRTRSRIFSGFWLFSGQRHALCNRLARNIE